MHKLPTQLTTVIQLTEDSSILCIFFLPLPQTPPPPPAPELEAWFQQEKKKKELHYKEPLCDYGGEAHPLLQRGKLVAIFCRNLIPQGRYNKYSLLTPALTYKGQVLCNKTAANKEVPVFIRSPIAPPVWKWFPRARIMKIMRQK